MIVEIDNIDTKVKVCLDHVLLHADVKLQV
jgi:hypothetical protein